MITEEFSNEFDILYNNISSNQAPGLDEYEKSVFLTQAQEALVIDLYRGTLGDSFESTEEVTRYLNSLVKSAGPYEVSTSIDTYGCKRFEVSPQNKILFIVFESAYTTKGQSNRDVLVERATHDTLAMARADRQSPPQGGRYVYGSRRRRSLLCRDTLLLADAGSPLGWLPYEPQSSHTPDAAAPRCATEYS